MLKTTELNVRIYTKESKEKDGKKILIDKTIDKVMSVGEALKMYNDYKKTGKDRIEIYSYSLLYKKFSYQTPNNFAVVPAMGKVIGVELTIDNESTYNCKLSNTSRALILSNQMQTMFAVGQMSNINGNSLHMGYIGADDKGNPKIEFKQVKRLFDYEEEVRKEAEKLKDVPKKAGRKPKNQPKGLTPLIDDDRVVVRIDFMDGSFTVAGCLCIK